MKNKKRIVFGFLTICWCCVIFSFSHSTGESSGGLSLKITEFLIHVVYPNFKNIDMNAQLNILDLCHFIVRKGAHMTEYAILYMFSHQFMSTYHLSLKKTMYYPMGFSILYALFDEFHQLFIDGRAGKLLDVGIDSCGVLLMMGMIYLFKKYFITNKTMV